MPLPTLQKTWRFSNNLLVSSLASHILDHKAALLQMKNCLKGSGITWKDSLGAVASAPSSLWTVVGSSNASASGMDAVDRWSTTSDITFNTAGSAHSWIVLKQTGIGSNFQICIDCANTSASNQHMNGAFYSMTAGFTGGSTTARPTATDEVNFWWSSNVAQNNSIWLGGLSVPFQTRHHTAISTDGAVTRHIIFINNRPALAFMVERVLNPVTLDGSANVWNGANIPFWCSFVSHNDLTNSLKDPLLYSVFVVPPTGGLKHYTRLGNAADPTQNQAASLFMTSEGGAPTSGDEFLLGRIWGAIPSDLTNEHIMAPAALACATTSFRGRHGQVYDMWLGVSVAMGSAYPDDGTRQFAQVNDVIFPWDRSIMLTS